MNETALYFPHIQVPRTPWFTQILLYWDKAATIVPNFSRQDRENFIHTHMEELASAGLLEFVRPSEALEFGNDAFETGFINLLDDMPVLDAMKSGVYDQFNRGNLPLNFSRVHSTKMPRRGGIADNLRRRGLLVGEEYGYFTIESHTAAMYMAYLASVISGAYPSMAPVTDRSDAFSALNRPGVERISDIAQLRSVVITQALPVPSREVSARELIEFKETNGELLRRCRIGLDAKLVELAQIEDRGLREIRGRLVTQEIEDEIQSLREKMERKRWPRVDLMGFCGVTAAGLTATEALMTSGSVLAQGFGVGIGILSLAPIMKQAIDHSRAPRSDPRREPLAYAALAGRQFG